MPNSESPIPPTMTPDEYEQLVAQLATRLTNSTRLIKKGKIGFGDENTWEGASGFPHQIDVSLANETEVLLIECKHWKRNIPPEAFLTLFGRVIDISKHEATANRTVRGALVTRVGAQCGVWVLTTYYSEQMSLFRASSLDDLEVQLHRHYIAPPSIPSTAVVYPPTISQSDP